MNRSQMCIANVQYKQASSRGSQQTSGLLGYLTYREGREAAAVQQRGVDRWTDHGMGRTIKDIADRCAALRSDHVLMFSLVVNPNPDLVAMIPPEKREAFVRELTENVVERFFEARDIDTGIEYSYCLHRRETTDPQSPGQPNPHSHVVLPGTVYDEGLGERVPLYFSRNAKVNHIDLLHGVTEQTIVPLLEREIGRDWEQRYDALERERAAERQVVESEPDFIALAEDGGEWAGWLGTRATDETTSAAGYYEEIAEDDSAPRVVFHPLVRGLSRADAERLTDLLRLEMGDDFARIRDMTAFIAGLSPGERESFLADIRQERAQEREREARVERTELPRERGIDLDIGF